MLTSCFFLDYWLDLGGVLTKFFGSNVFILDPLEAQRLSRGRATERSGGQDGGDGGVEPFGWPDKSKTRPVG